MLNDKELFPQFVCSSMIQEVHSLEGKPVSPYWQFDEEKFQQEMGTLHQVLQSLQQDAGVVVIWFLLEEAIKAQHLANIEKQLTDKISKLLSADWEVEVMLIPGTTTSAAHDLLIDIEAHIHQLMNRYPFEYFVQIVGFGEYAPFQALFLEGMRHFENRYAALYWDGKRSHITFTEYETSTTSWSQQFRAFVNEYDYQAALKLLEEKNDSEVAKGLSCLLQSMLDRLNFAFSESIAHIKESTTYLGESDITTAMLKTLKPLVSKERQERDLARIVELYRQLDAYLEVNDLASFLIRFYRAREAVLYYVLHYNEKEDVPRGRHGTIYEVVDQLESKFDEGQIEQFYGAYFYLRSSNVGRALHIRNQSFIGHGRDGVSGFQLWSNYYGTSRTTMEKAKRRFMLDTNLLFKDLGADMQYRYSSINKYILQLSASIL
ncbi:hypothetical protein [Bacillus anthracis]|uniref:hypothetical protein n=1 Tax=Bacillus anthracis TaxID=1392 RepID=UPI003BA1600B